MNKPNGNANFWWLVANPEKEKSHWSFTTSVELGGNGSYGAKKENGSYKSNFKNVKTGDIIIAYHSGSIQKVVAICVIINDTDEVLHFRKIADLEKPLSSEAINNDEIGKTVEYFATSSLQKPTLSKLKPEQYNRIIEMISKNNSLDNVDFGISVDNQNNKECHDQSYQQIFYGAPGTGKSHTIKKQESTFAKVIRTTFHPDTDYSTFVGAYKPTREVVKDESGIIISDKITYTFVKQAFLKAYIEAWKRIDKDDVLLVIEEINRGNCAQIFGDIFQLLDRETEGKEEGYSSYAIEADTDIEKVLQEEFAYLDNIPDYVKSGEKLLLPPNLYIWATMNTSDQSLFPIDSAFKRRWDWKYVPINTQKEDWVIEVNGSKYSWTSFLNVMNERIYDKTESEDKQLGFYFCKAKNNIISVEKFVSKVLFYIYNDVYKDYGFDDDFFEDANSQKLSYSKFYYESGKVVENKVSLFLKNLGLNPLSPQEEVEEFGRGGNIEGTSSRIHRIVWGGEMLEDSYRKLIVKVVEKIGPDNISSDITGITIKSREDITENIENYAQLSNGKYLYNRKNGSDMRTAIRNLAVAFNVDLSFE